MFIGPWDLGNNIGRPVTGEFHADLSAAVDRIFKAAVNNGKRVGIYCAGGAAAKKYADQGFHMVRPNLSSCNGKALIVFRSLSSPMLLLCPLSLLTHWKPPKDHNCALPHSSSISIENHVLYEFCANHCVFSTS